jgi:DNA-directed RNA polymerase specialized sigma24 family protein
MRTQALAPREKRAWVTKIMAKAEEVESAQDELSDMFVDAYDAGMSYGQLGASLGLHSTTMKDRIENARAARDQRGGKRSR